jgi:urease beta subunit
MAEIRETTMIPGEYILRADPIEANVDRDTVDIDVTNHGDRPIQVGSHFHFFEVNKALVFPRRLAFGKRLNIPAGTAVRFEPGDCKRVTLVALAGRQEVYGLNNLSQGAVTDAARAAAMQRVVAQGFGNTEAGTGRGEEGPKRPSAHAVAEDAPWRDRVGAGRLCDLPPTQSRIGEAP